MNFPFICSNIPTFQSVWFLSGLLY